jgi:hypothetical protein
MLDKQTLKEIVLGFVIGIVIIILIILPIEFYSLRKDNIRLVNERAERAKQYIELSSYDQKLGYDKGLQDGELNTLKSAALNNHGYWEINPLDGKVRFVWYKVKINPVNPLPSDDIYDSVMPYSKDD